MKTNKRKIFVVGIIILLICIYQIKIIPKIKNQFYFVKEKVNDKTLGYKDQVEEIKLNLNIDETKTSDILGIIMQESHGYGDDPMQSSESKCGKINCIKDPIESINAGLGHLKKIEKYIQKNKMEYTIETLLQAYNFGLGFIDYLIENKYNKRTRENSEEYSKHMCGKSNTSIKTAVNLNVLACYGDYLYVEHVNRYIT